MDKARPSIEDKRRDDTILRLNRIVDTQEKRIKYLEWKSKETEMMIRKLSANIEMLRRRK